MQKIIILVTATQFKISQNKTIYINKKKKIINQIYNKVYKS